MIRRKRRTAKQRALLEFKQKSAVSIGETRDQQRVREAQEEVQVIAAVRREVFTTRLNCQLCHGARRRECFGPDQLHEDPSRAKTRGWPVTDRFNLRVCGRLCEACHRDVTEHRLVIVFTDPALRFAATVYPEVPNECIRR